MRFVLGVRTALPHSREMGDISLTGAQRARLRGLGQTRQPVLTIGREGASAGVLAELGKALETQELIKLRFFGLDRHERADLCTRLAQESRSECVGAVGHTALFYRPHPDPTRRMLV